MVVALALVPVLPSAPASPTPANPVARGTGGGSAALVAVPTGEPPERLRIVVAVLSSRPRVGGWAQGRDELDAVASAAAGVLTGAFGSD
ncbi:hypothetical protein ACQP04_01690 [Pseudonocardia halophobica]|uniref:hypothetical protein n=1 Tax=Pseudonocardia halophobica TaxID=29401 RepID=UPI003D9333AD